MEGWRSMTLGERGKIISAVRVRASQDQPSIVAVKGERTVGLYERPPSADLSTNAGNGQLRPGLRSGTSTDASQRRLSVRPSNSSCPSTSGLPCDQTIRPSMKTTNGELRLVFDLIFPHTLARRKCSDLSGLSSCLRSEAAVKPC